ncbi:MAG: hypothetical protein QXD57_04945 [Ignisphaera sp.]
MVEFKAKTPDERIKCVVIAHLRVPHSIVTLRNRGYRESKEPRREES